MGNGDVGYSNQKFIKVGFKNVAQLTTKQKNFNQLMWSFRVAVEYGFGKILQQFAYLDYKKNQQIYLCPLKKMYFVGAFLLTVMYQHLMGIYLKFSTNKLSSKNVYLILINNQ